MEDAVANDHTEVKVLATRSDYEALDVEANENQSEYTAIHVPVRDDEAADTNKNTEGQLVATKRDHEKDETMHAVVTKNIELKVFAAGAGYEALDAEVSKTTRQSACNRDRQNGGEC